VAINCGSLVERGGDPAVAGLGLLDALPRLAAAAGEFYGRARALAAADKRLMDELRQESTAGADDDESAEAHPPTPAALLEEYIAHEGWERLARQFGPVLFQDQPAAVLGHMAEDFFRLGLIAHLSRSTDLRRAACARPALLEQTLRLDDAAGAPRSFLAMMLRVLDDEPLLVLHVEQKKGFEVRIGGLADNFQLHTLLAGAVIGSSWNGWLTGTAPGKRALAECRDAPVGPGGGAEMTGAFNLYNWTALRPDGTLPEGIAVDATGHWIWNEGCPADITPFEGRRVVLLGRPAYNRMWRAGRIFGGMTGELTVERKLARGEVAEWLERLARADRPGAGGR